MPERTPGMGKFRSGDPRYAESLDQLEAVPAAGNRCWYCRIDPAASVLYRVWGAVIDSSVTGIGQLLLQIAELPARQLIRPYGIAVQAAIVALNGQYQQLRTAVARSDQSAGHLTVRLTANGPESVRPMRQFHSRVEGLSQLTGQQQEYARSASQSCPDIERRVGKKPDGCRQADSCEQATEDPARISFCLPWRLTSCR